MSTTIREAPLDLQQMQAEGVQSYRAIVIELARGNEPAPSAVREALAMSTKSFEALQTDVARVAARFDAAGKLKKAAAVRKKADKLKVKQVAAAKHLAEAEVEARRLIDEARGPVFQLQESIHELETEARELTQAGTRVLASSRDPSIETTIGEKQAVRGRLVRELQEHEAAIKAANEWRQEVEVWATGADLESARFNGKRIFPAWHPRAGAFGQVMPLTRSEWEYAEARIVAVEKAKPKHEASAVELQKKIDAIASEIKAIAAQRLNPERMDWNT